MSSTDNTDTPTQDFDTTTLYVGRVKWFNNKAGYGFCTVVGQGTDRVGEDVFVHHTAVNVNSEQYKYLVQGEYVHFNLRSSDSGSHPYQAANLTGLFGGWLMCETRNEQRQQRAEHGDDDVSENSRPPHRNRTVRLQGSGPRSSGPRSSGPRSSGPRSSGGSQNNWSLSDKKTHRAE
jgi:cold shock CspA family protein